jgi:penicillin amidase
MGRGFHPLFGMTFFAARRIGHLVKNIKTKPNNWFSASSWEIKGEEALGNAIKTLKNNYGHKIADWKWGSRRKLTISHPLASQKPLDRIFNLGPVALGGDANTVSQAASPPSDPFSRITPIASMRMSIDVGKWQNNRFVLSSGQSGNPLSPHYDDMLVMWLKGEGVPIH